MIKHILFDLRRKKRFIKNGLQILVSFIVVAVVMVNLSAYIHDSDVGRVSYAAKQEIVAPKNLEGTLYFNDQPNSRIFTDLITEAIDRALETVEVTMFSMSLEEVHQALLDAHNQDVFVQLILDISRTEKHKDVFGPDSPLTIIEIGGDIVENGDSMHHKFTIIDRNLDSARLLTGSLNYTDIQEKYDPSFVFDTHDPDIIQAFKEENDLLKDDLRGYRKLREDRYKPLSRAIQYDNGFLEVWFGPGFKENSLKQRILDLVEGAEHNLDIVNWRVNDWDIANALIKKAKEGIQIRIITDDYYLWSEESAFPNMIKHIQALNLDNVEIVSDLYRTLDFHNVIETDESYFNPYIHQHTLIVDQHIVLTGTNNWTYNGFFKNDENAFVSDVEFFVEGFRSSFEYHYQELRNQTLRHLVDENNTLIFNADAELLGKEIVVYNELSEIEHVPDLCFTATINQLNQQISIPSKCNTLKSVLLVLDENKEVYAGGYLQF